MSWPEDPNQIPPQKTDNLRSFLLSEFDLPTKPTDSRESEWLDTTAFESAPIPTATENSEPITFSAPTPVTADAIAPKAPAALILGSKIIPQILAELESYPDRLLKLNPSRRKAVSDYLEWIDQGFTSGRSDILEWLRQSSGNYALKSYFEEVAILTLAQAVLLKRWNDLQIRAFKKEDLGKLNWEICSALKIHVPMLREPWNLTKPNLFSWYQPSEHLQKLIYDTLVDESFRDQTSDFISQWFLELRHKKPEWPESFGYDSRFYHACLKNIPTMGVQFSREKRIFSPTLRKGQMDRAFRDLELEHVHGPVHVFGFESNPALLILGEIDRLWNGPVPPPYWALGFGLESHAKEQMDFTQFSTNLSKPQSNQLLYELESFDFSYLFEERGIKSSRFKALLDTLPFYKKLRSPHTSLGALQACVAISKLRPGAKFLWVREHRLSLEESPEAMQYLMGKAKLLGEINLDKINHQLPSNLPLFPKYLSLWEKEPNNEVRSAHVPRRLFVQGQLRSHIELSFLLEDIFRAISGAVTTPKTHWKILEAVSHPPQKDWLTHWPMGDEQSDLTPLEILSEKCVNLSEIATVRPCPKPSEGSPVPMPETGLWLPAKKGGQLSASTGFSITFRTTALKNQMSIFLQTEWIKNWMSRQTTLSEASLKLMPFPELLVNASEWSRSGSNDSQAVDMILEEPKAIETMEPLAGLWAAGTVHAHLEKQRERLSAMFNPTGSVHWLKLLPMIPIEDCLPLPRHPQVQIEGQLPPLTPIIKSEPLKNIPNTLWLLTEPGHQIRLHVEGKLLFELIRDQLKNMPYATWNEIIGSVKAPRQLSQIEGLGNDLLKRNQDLTIKRNLTFKIWKGHLERNFL